MDTYKINSYDVLPGMVLEFPALYVSVLYVHRDHDEEQVYYNGLVILREEIVPAHQIESRVIIPTTVDRVHFADDVTVVGSNWDFSIGRFVDIVCDRRLSVIDGFKVGKRRSGPVEGDMMIDLRHQSVLQREEIEANPLQVVTVP